MQSLHENIVSFYTQTVTGATLENISTLYNEIKSQLNAFKINNNLTPEQTSQLAAIEKRFYGFANEMLLLRFEYLGPGETLSPVLAKRNVLLAQKIDSSYLDTCTCIQYYIDCL